MNSTSANKAVISCSGLYKTYDEGPQSVEVLHDINLQITVGESVAIVGASGSGKSTLLHLMGGLDLPTKGNVVINGQDVVKINENARGKLRNQTLGFVYQFHHLLMEFTALENVSLPLLIRGIDTQEAIQESKQILQKVGLGHRLEHKPNELSGGERQRAAIARALVTQPKCVLADEPTGNLDNQTARHIFELMMELNQEFQTSFVVVTHDHEFASHMNRVMNLHDGKIQ